MTTTITGKNQVTLPAELVREHDWKPGTKLEWTKTCDGALVARRKRTRGELARQIMGTGKHLLKPGESAVEGLLGDRAGDDALDLEDEACFP
jgi:bifunctional DNA-binding transcriptional regulator/antitoxin component of YhaV-PrlF toxin-antitoxin module